LWPHSSSRWEYSTGHIRGIDGLILPTLGQVSRRHDPGRVQAQHGHVRHVSHNSIERMSVDMAGRSPSGKVSAEDGTMSVFHPSRADTDWVPAGRRRTLRVSEPRLAGKRAPGGRGKPPGTPSCRGGICTRGQLGWTAFRFECAPARLGLLSPPRRRGPADAAIPMNAKLKRCQRPGATHSQRIHRTNSCSPHCRRGTLEAEGQGRPLEPPLKVCGQTWRSPSLAY
jgi:hypothetical protein